MKLIKIVFYVVAPILVFGLSTYLTISLLLKFQQTTVCPDVRGKTVEDARELVKKQGLAFVVLRYERRNDVPYNHITVQKPDANISTKKGRVVYVIVSEGRNHENPGFVGLPSKAQAVFSEMIWSSRRRYGPPSRVGKVMPRSRLGERNNGICGFPFRGSAQGVLLMYVPGTSLQRTGR